MNESKKLLIGFGVILVICCCTAGIAFFAFRQFSTRMESGVNGNPTSVAKAKAEIADFDIPSGYAPVTFNFFTYNMITLNPDTSSSGMMIMLMQYTGVISGNSDQMEEQLRRSLAQQNNQPGTSMTVVDTHEEVIRGQTVTVTISEGRYESFTIRQWSTVFKGNKGPTILMVQGAAETWDDQLLEDFIKSIK
ncbi:MAG: hypothetical protein HZB50_00620 [Chloroflexi bacterium]|nr:hypothetical protein [Chloroflexota bacterium]